jgi:hypothetical protein
MDFEVTTKQIERLTERIGMERCAERDQEVECYQRLKLVERKDKPSDVTAPSLAVVGVDGGRLQIRDRRDSRGKKRPTPTADTAGETDEGTDTSLPPDEKHRGTHWREDKIGVLMTMTSQVAASDPCPEVPKAFVDPTRILNLTRELKTKRSAAEVAAKQEALQGTDHPEVAEEALHTGVNPVAWKPPEVQDKQLAATRRPWSEFGPMLAARAWHLGFYKAERRAFLGDGSENNWTLHKRHFSNFVPILDIIHAISYVFAAAMAGRPFREGWPIYQDWVTRLWGGEVEKIIAALAQRQAELGTPEAGDGETHPRQVVAVALGYLQNHKDKMRYAEYRRQGLPITSSYVESAVKQFNYRVKGTEKFWSEDGAEALLQLRADQLSDDVPLLAFWQRRQAAQTGLRNYPAAA